MMKMNTSLTLDSAKFGAELNKPTRKFVYGDRTRNTVKHWVEEVVILKIGNPTRKQPPLSNQQVANKLGVSRRWIIELVKLAIKTGLAEADPNNSVKIKLPKQTKDEKTFLRLKQDKFAQHPIIQEWIQDMRSRNDGEGLVGWENHVNGVHNICNTLKINPEQLIVNKETTKKLFLNFLDAIKDGQEEFTQTVNARKRKSIKNTRKHHITALRSFCAKFGIAWAKGEDPVMGNKVVGHGNYAGVRFTKGDFEVADLWLKKHYGVDSDLYRFFWFGVESCAREQAILGAKCEWEEVPDDDKVIFVMKVFESKTKHLNAGIWEKFITKEELQQSLIKHKRKGNALIWTKKSNNMNKIVGDFRNQLRELYHAVGKIPNIKELEENRKNKEAVSDNYFFEKPIHTLRHIGAHYWLDKTDYDYGIVADVGGWHTIDELKKSYGAMPAEMKYKKIKEARKH